MTRSTSVIIPCFNAAAYVGDAVRSVLNQTCPVLEIVIIDDGSTDGTRMALDAFIANGKVRYYLQKNQGAAAARNRGIDESKGDFVAFLDADDVWESDKLAKQLELFKKQSVGLVYSDMELFSGSHVSGMFSEMTHGFWRGNVTKKLLNRNFVPTSSVVVRKKLLEDVGRFSEDKKLFIGEDYHLWIRISTRSEFDFIEKPLVRYRIHDFQVTNKSKMQTQRSLEFLYGDLLAREEFAQFKGTLLKKRLESRVKKYFYKWL